MESSTGVLVVGGGLVGLSAALILARREVPTVLVERHAGSSPHPRAIGFTPRTLELFRAVGIGSKVPEAPAGTGRPRRVRVESLAGAWSPEVEWTPTRSDGSPPPDGYSPCTGAAIAQDRLEPVLRDSASELGADVRMSTELVSFRQDDTGVVATVRPRGTGDEYTIRADHMIAADGHASPVRAALGIARSGHGFMHVVRSVLFRAELDEYLEAGISQFELDQPGLTGMLTTYRDGRWLLMFSDDEERDEATLRRQVIRALGRADIPVELITTGRWHLSALIADRFSVGRVFLAGDAAHTLPPARGGYGANTGIEDAYNLAWKLAAVHSGASAPALLGTYDTERRPIAWLRHDQIFAWQDYAAVATAEEQQVPVIEDVAMEWGQLYRSAAVIGADDDLPPALRPPQWAGQPGTRAQHLWVSHDGRRCSTLDLLQHTWVLLTEDPAWRAAASAAARTLRLDLRCLIVSATADPAAVSPPQDPTSLTLDTPIEQMPYTPPSTDPALFPARVRAAFGIGASGCSLIRPDGYIAWRSVDMPTDPAAAVTAALRTVASALTRYGTARAVRAYDDLAAAAPDSP